MKTHSFTLILDVKVEDTNGLEQELYDAGFDDALLGFTGPEVYLDVDRESRHNRAETIAEAVGALAELGIYVRLAVASTS